MPTQTLCLWVLTHAWARSLYGILPQESDKVTLLTLKPSYQRVRYVKLAAHFSVRHRVIGMGVCALSIVSNEHQLMQHLYQQVMLTYPPQTAWLLQPAYTLWQDYVKHLWFCSATIGTKRGASCQRNTSVFRGKRQNYIGRLFRVYWCIRMSCLVCY